MDETDSTAEENARRRDDSRRPRKVHSPRRPLRKNRLRLRYLLINGIISHFTAVISLIPCAKLSQTVTSPTHDFVTVCDSFTQQKWRYLTVFSSSTNFSFYYRKFCIDPCEEKRSSTSPQRVHAFSGRGMRGNAVARGTESRSERIAEAQATDLATARHWPCPIGSRVLA